ncbi:phospholipid-translocating ATPase [Vigna unguiculata]|uniref:Phospholipid-translocating ATPase n=1 Tax=Vigna unguiculata TaxID=3917 RepID=A0A4D6M3J7_VIGUN|nr:phospholipid-translocating ATPase [Vigna unguiculata]
MSSSLQVIALGIFYHVVSAKFCLKEKQRDKQALAKASLESIKKQIGEGISQINSAKESCKSGFGLIIDGKSLDYSLNKNLERSFFELATNCASVICCRSSPKQKARVSSTMVVVCVLLPYFSFSSF